VYQLFPDPPEAPVMYCLLSNNSERDPWKFNAIDESEIIRKLFCSSSKLVVEDYEIRLNIVLIVNWVL
jgi:hypothetical protein